MQHFLLLMRVQILALMHSFAPRARKTHRTAGATLIALSYIVLTGVVAVYLVMLGFALMMMGLANAIPAFAVLMGSVAGVIFTFLKANGTLFGLADFDLVMALPIPRRTVVASRVMALYVSAATLGAVLSLPLWGVYLIFVNASAWSVLCCVVSIVLAPAAPTAIATFLAFGVAALSSHFRHANIAYVAIALVAFAVLTVGLYGFSLSSGVNGHDASLEQLESGLALANEALGIGWPPARWMADACSTGSLVGMGLFLLVSIAIPAIALEIMQRFYLAINAALSTGRRGRALSAGELKTRSSEVSRPFRALVIKEYRTLLGVPSYAFNCLFGYLLMIILAIALGAVGIEPLLGLGSGDGAVIDAATYRMVESVIANVLPWIFVFCCIASPSAACSVSMEGKAAWLCATAPLPVRTVLGAKLAANALPIAGSLMLSAVILLCTGRIDAIGAAQVLLTGFGSFYLMVNIGMALDARQPNFSWSSPNEVVKRGMPVTVTVIGGMALTFAGVWIAIALSVGAGPLAGLGLGTVAGTLWNLLVGAIGVAAGQLIFRRTCRTARLYLG